MPVKIISDDNKGLYQQYDASSGGTVGIKQSRSSSGDAAETDTITSGAITIPANSVITAYHVIVSSEITISAACDVGVIFGTSDNDDSHMVIDAASMCAEADAITTFDVGFGNSTDTNISDSLDTHGTNTKLTALAGAQKIGTSDVTLYGKMLADGETFDAGTVQFVIEFITFS